MSLFDAEWPPGKNPILPLLKRKKKKNQLRATKNHSRTRDLDIHSFVAVLSQTGLSCFGEEIDVRKLLFTDPLNKASDANLNASGKSEPRNKEIWKGLFGKSTHLYGKLRQSNKNLKDYIKKINKNCKKKKSSYLNPQRSTSISSLTRFVSSTFPPFSHPPFFPSRATVRKWKIKKKKTSRKCRKKRAKRSFEIP